MLRLLFVGIGLIATASVLFAQDKKADDRVKVDVFLATEHVPKELKAGSHADLKIVTGKTVGPRGVAIYNASLLAADVEVVSMETVDKPAAPEAAMKVQLLVAKDKSEKVVKARDETVMVVERKPDGTVETKKKPVTLRLEVPKPEKK